MSIIRDALKKAQEKRESEQANRGGEGPERIGWETSPRLNGDSGRRLSHLRLTTPN